MDEVTLLKHRVMALEENARRNRRLLEALLKAMEMYERTGQIWVGPDDLKKRIKDCIHTFAE